VSSKRVVIIGMDGGTFELMMPWIAEGDLPNLAHLIANGSHGPLASTIQPTTAPAWVTFMTGVNQGKHGLYDFVQRRPESYNLQVTNATHVRAPTLFDIASWHGLKVVAINVPYTFPPHPVNGVIVGGPFAPSVSRELVSPPRYYDLLQETVPNYFVLPDYEARVPDPLADYADKLMDGIAMRERLSLRMLREVPWDLFMVVFMATDEAQHTFWHCMEAAEGSPEARYRRVIHDIYRRVDQAVGAILEQVAVDGQSEETVVLVVSDHGAGPFYLMVNLTEWLAQEGYLVFRSDRRGYLNRLYAGWIKRLMRVYRRYLPADVRATIRGRLGADLFDQAKGGFESVLLTDSIAWEQTRAYSLGAGGNIYLNVRGREPLGIVEPGTEYDKLCQALIDALMKMQDPQTKKPIVRRVYRREELYHGPALNRAPDLIIEWVDYGYWGRGRYDGRAPVFDVRNRVDFSDRPLTGSHRPEGILIAYGAGIPVGGRIEGARLLDMAPTVLGLLGVPPAAEMDGELLLSLLTIQDVERLRELTAKQISPMPDTDTEFGFGPEEEELISRHLRSLGYL